MSKHPQPQSYDDLQPKLPRDTWTIIHIFRHAQSSGDLSISDPPLSEHGKSQCDTFSFPHNGHITEIFCSPMTRTIETALLCFAHRRIPIKLLPNLQPLHHNKCGVGLDAAKIKRRYIEARNLDTLDCSLLENNWNSKEGKWNPEQTALAMKEAELYFRGIMVPRSGQREVMVIGHSSWIKEFLKRHNIYREWAPWTDLQCLSFVFSPEGKLQQVSDDKVKLYREVIETSRENGLR